MKNKKIILVVIICAVILVSITVALTLLFTKCNVLEKLKIKTPEDNLIVSESKIKEIKLVDYECNNFTMKIPEGWTVTTGGTEMYYAILVRDPLDERNQIFAVLKAAPILKSNASKQWHAWYVNTTGNSAYKIFSDAIILNPATTENFYNNFNSYADYAKTYEPTYSSFSFPFISLFSPIESFESNTYIKNLSLDDKTIRATFEDSNGKSGEGLFMSSIVDMGSVYAGSVDTMFYTAYNVMFITSAKDEFINYQNVLTKSLASLEYKNSFVSDTNQKITERTNEALRANAAIQAAYDSYNNAWSARQKTYDITSQKYSDATLGYERVYDTETGDVYKAYNGFTDDYKGSRYEAVTDDMYTNTISGFIDKVN